MKGVRNCVPKRSEGENMAYYYGLTIYYIAACLFLKKGISVKTKKVYVYCALLPALILVAFRNITVGNDTYMYFYAYEKYKTYKTLAKIVAKSLREPGFLLLNYICIKIGRSYYFLQIIIGIFTYYSFYKFFSRYSLDPWLSCLLMLLNRHIFGTMNAMRMWLAIAVVLFAFPYVIKRKFIPVLILSMIAMTFHFTAIIIIAFYFMAGMKWTTKRVLTWIGISGVLAFFGHAFFTLISRILNRYSNYLKGGYFDSGGTATYLSLVIQLLLFAFIYYEYLKWKRFYETGTRSTEAISIEDFLVSSVFMVLLLDIIGVNNTIMSRVSAFFAPAMCIAIPWALMCCRTHNRRILSFFIIVFHLLYFVIVMRYRPGWYGVSEYAFMWQH